MRSKDSAYWDTVSMVVDAEEDEEELDDQDV